MSIEPCESTLDAELDFCIGWFSVARSDELKVGAVMRVRAFDRELALYRTRSGLAVIQDAFCPHLGAHLGVEGRVIGESIRCPFHGWRYDSTGQCVEIPYCEDIPERAKIRTWPSCEANGDIMMWYHPQEQPPAWEVPVLEEFSSDEWSQPQTWEFTIPNHVQNIAENTCDPVHFQFVHRMPITPPNKITVDEDGRVLRLIADATESDFPSELQVAMHNPGLAVVRNVYGPGAEMLVYSTAQPVSKNETHMRWTLSVTKNIVDVAGDEMMRGIKEGIGDDMPIWQHKVYKAKPVFCKADESLVGFRKWVRQFYL